ncbi:MAG: HAD family hydrolase [Bacteroidales bacterium]|nr:HAD family hydrolase [Bacteroidales bacterium]
MIQLIAFDLDGTIADTIPICIDAFREAVSPYFGRELSEKEIIQTFGLNEEGMIKKVIDKDWKNALEDFYTQYQKMHVRCPDPFEGAKELILQLKAHHLIVGLITGKGERSCRITLQQFGMENYFDFIETGSPDKNIKSEALINCRNQYHLSSDELVYIGDTVSDILSCKQAGIQCLSAGWATSAESDQLQKYNKGYVFQTIDSLKEYIFHKIQIG